MNLPKKIPSQSGVYLFKNSKGNIIYIGKAANLHKRLKSYFSNRLAGKNKLMFEKACSVKWQTVASEFDALLLESKLIKKFKPQYNQQHKDDKTYPSIAISTSETFPRIYFTRERNETKKNPQVLFFGPFPSAQKVKEVLVSLRKMFPYRSCKTLPKKPCLYYHLDLCQGICAHPQESYKTNIKNIIKILKGQSKKVHKQLKKQMLVSAKKQHYEKAARIKKQIQSLQAISVKTSSKLNSLLFCDRIEGYDISNISGQQASGSMVVFTNNQPSKKDYRRFKIKTIKSANDPAMIAELIKRRLNHPEWDYPDLILVDGGKTQVNAVLKILQEAKFAISVVGIAKENETIFFKEKNRWRQENFPQSSPLLKLFQRVRDEAHRFAQSYHHKLRIKAFISCFVAALFFSLPLPVFANKDFYTKQEVVYEIQESATTKVIQTIALTNQTSSVYATQYNLTINTLQIDNFHAWDNFGPLKSTISQFGDTTEVGLKFNEKIVGLGETMIFSFEYQSGDLAVLNGRILEINLPKIETFDLIDEFQATIVVPQKFGPSAYLSPSPSQIIPSDKKTEYLFSKIQLEQGKIQAAFGDYQVFRFNLIYHLSNPSSAESELEIALPPDTAYQNVYYQQLNPKPQRMELDADANWLAFYRLKSNQKLEIKASGYAQVFLEPQRKEPLNSDQFKALVKADQYWPTTEEKIFSASQNLKDAQAIYNYLISQLEYDYDRIKVSADRVGPLVALEQKKGLCLEFTDLFVTLARTIAIPARAVNGYAYSRDSQVKALTGKKDILHSWPEYYDQERQVWVAVDPTWGETTEGRDFFNQLDYNHFAFVIHGHDDEFPLAAGSYKLKESQEDTVQVEFSDQLPMVKSQLEVIFSLPEKVVAGLSTSGHVKVINLGNTAFYNQTLNLQSFPHAIVKETQFTIPFIAPFSEKEFPVKLRPAKIFFTGNEHVTAQVGDYSAYEEIQVNTLLNSKNLVYVLLALLASLAFFLIKNLKRR